MIIYRVGAQPFQVKRGDRVRYRNKNVTVRGISKARKEIRIESDNAAIKGGFWVYYSYIYPPLPEVTEVTTSERLSNAIDSVNAANEPLGGWDDRYKVPN